MGGYDIWKAYDLSQLAQQCERCISCDEYLDDDGSCDDCDGPDHHDDEVCPSCGSFEPGMYDDRACTQCAHELEELDGPR